MVTAKLFQNGGSQAVRIPKAFRFDAEEVYIKETPMGLLLIPHTEEFWSRWLNLLREHQWDVESSDIDDSEPQERAWDDLFA